jgi:hypothetical protein
MKAMRLLLAPLLMVLSACSSGPRAPDWQVQAQGAAERYTSAYLAGSLAADAEWQRTRAAVAATAQPQRMARAELLRCAVQVASLDWRATCEGFDAFKSTALPDLPAQAAYADYLQGRWTPAAMAHLSPPQRRVAEQGAPALPAIDPPLSRLLGAAVLLRSGSVPPAEQDALVALAVDTASAQGWRRPLLAWLGLQLQRAQAQGRTGQAELIRQRLALLESPA